MSSPSSIITPTDQHGLQLALAAARAGYESGGVPIGSALLDLSPPHGGFAVLGVGHNERVQKGSATLHAEMAALEGAGRLGAEVYRRATMYTTLSPCSMCTGAILLYNIPRVVIGENHSFKGDEDLLRARGVEVVVVDDDECKKLMGRFIEEKPKVWNEDIGEP